MTYDLAIGDRGYSSWSLRGWLLFDAFGIPVKTHRARLYTDEFPALLGRFAPARTVPALRTPEGNVVLESLAIAEELASRHPEAGLWPADPGARAVARTLAAEMHAGFVALRSHCPMNLRVSYEGCAPPEPVLADLARLETIWDWARTATGARGRGFAATIRWRTRSLRRWRRGLPATTCRWAARRAAYVEAHLAHPSFRRWRAMGLVRWA